MGDKNKFDVNYHLLPPRLQVQLWVLGLDANTSRVNIAYSPGAFRTSLSYHYGGNVKATLGIRRFSLSVGVNPTKGDTNLHLGMVFRGFDFGPSFDVAKRAPGFELKFGQKLLPFPDELSSVFNEAHHGLLRMRSDLSAAPNDPLGFYRLHSNDIHAISKALEAGNELWEHQHHQRHHSHRFRLRDHLGGRLRLNYAPDSGFLIYGAVGLYF